MKSSKQLPAPNKDFVKVVVTETSAKVAKAVETNGVKMNC